MNKKGFTLIEVLAVIVILSIIALIVFPEINKIMKNSKQKAYNTQIDSLVEATRKLAQKDNTLYPEGSNVVCVTLQQLRQAGEIETDEIYDPRDTNVKLTGVIVISNSNEYNQYIYTYSETCPH